MGDIMDRRANRARHRAGTVLSCLVVAPPVLLCATGALADAPVVLEPVVVSATATERPLADAPATVTVITGDELQQRPVQDLADALRDTPGIMAMLWNSPILSASHGVKPSIS